LIFYEPSETTDLPDWKKIDAPLLSFDLEEATYLAPNFDKVMSREELIAERTKMFQKRRNDLLRVRDQVLKSRWEGVKALENKNPKRFIDFEFKPGILVLNLVRNSRSENIQ
jgi:hypothetical protein